VNEEKEEKILNPFAGVVSLLIYVVIGFLAAQIISLLLVLPFIMDFSNPQLIIEKFNNPIAYPELRYPLLFMQLIASVVTFIVVPILYMKIYKIDFDELTGRFYTLKPVLILSVIVLIFSVFPFLNFLFEWNMSWTFPFGMHEWALEKEEQMKQMTEYLLKMNGLNDLALTLIVVAIIPGIGEELLFRGLLQTQLSFAIKNIHIVIWLTAFIFSAIHMQFFGLIPRILLGGLFGYIYYWSGSLKYSMIAHAFNNGFQVVVTYILSTSETDYSLEEQTSFPIYATFMSLLFTIAIMIYLKNNLQKNELENSI